MKWKYKNKTINSPPKDAYGFVYKIEDKTTGEFYYGSKTFWSRRNEKISKKRANELYSGKGRRKQKELKIRESDWLTYNSSSKELQRLILEKGEFSFSFNILSMHNTKQELLLAEAFLIIKEFLKFNNKILNQWVSVKSFKLK
jgi:hypothetical protein